MKTALCMLSVLAAAGCKGTPTPPPAAVGDWHVAGGSSGSFSSTDGGDFGDTDEFSVNAAAGRFVADGLLVEGLAIVSSRSHEDPGGNDSDTTISALGAGVRFFTDTQSVRRPYLGVAGGVAHFDVDDDASGLDDSDTVPFLQGHAGIESFLSDMVAIDLGVFLRQVMDLEIDTAEDDLTTVGLSIGLSVWL